MKFKNLSVGKRLGAGFSLVLILVIIMSVAGVSYLRGITQAMDTVTSDYLVRERLSTEWLSIIETNGALGLVVMTTPDAGIKQYAIGEMKKNSERASVVQKSLESRVTTERGKALMKAVSEIRKTYSDTRKEVLKVSAQGDNAVTSELIRTRLLPAMQEYSAAVKAVVNHQQTLIDKVGVEVQSSGSVAIWTLMTLGIFALIVGALLALFITRSITRPLLSAVKVAREVASGNLLVDVKVESRDQLGQLMQALRDMADSLRNTVRKVREGSDNIASAASEIAAGNHDLSARTEAQSASVEETAATLEELTATINNTAGNTAQASQFVTETTTIVKENGAVMNDVSIRIQEIYDSSSRMADIIQVIDGIAFQTNILALNAAVEAARAGESGRGFAVVAGEVRTLAQRTTSAAREIKALIDDSVSRISAGRTLVEKADKGMISVVSNVQNMAQLINEIARASQEQSDGIAQINIAMGQIDATTQQNAALVEESAAAAASMQDQSQGLQEIVSVFRLNEGAGTGSADPTKHASGSLVPKPQPARKPSALPASADNWVTF
ncbi:methyl-accepting chemotaxis protein [Pantoea osteomyelitidis]|uniref:Methyl-accepting chemotaxis protein n=1 Tax=Pantoea osteomyelitidis TaxID=3230026 RepID=A0ABW7PTD7_9GAMM